VSHGYIVAAIEPTFEVPAVAFPDGRVLGISEDATGRHKISPPGDTKEKFLQRLHDFDSGHLDKWAADVRFVIDKITELNAADKDAEPFSGRVDLSNIAAWGNSFGGEAAARACQTEPRVKACLNADGAGPDGPVFAYPGTSLPSQPFLWMDVHHASPTEELLTMFHTTREAWDADHQAQAAAGQKELKASPGGSFHVTIHLPGTEHFSFTDKPFIDAKTPEDSSRAASISQAIGQYTLAFFDRYLKQQSGGALESGNNEVTVETFPETAK
jgi:dienelactone hydrolase